MKQARRRNGADARADFRAKHERLFNVRITKEKGEMPIAEMDDNHLINAIKFDVRRGLHKDLEKLRKQNLTYERLVEIAMLKGEREDLALRYETMLREAGRRRILKGPVEVLK